jgi:hypothetical protein
MSARWGFFSSSFHFEAVEKKSRTISKSESKKTFKLHMALNVVLQPVATISHYHCL